VQGSHGVCETTWHGNIFFKGFGVRLDKIQHLEVDARGIYNEAYSQNPKDDSCDGVDCGLEC